MSKVTKAVIPVAGFGTRFLPITKAVPKMMLPILDKPILQIIAKEAADSGITDILFIVGRHAEIIEQYFSADEELYARLEGDKYTKIMGKVKEVEGIANYFFTVQDKQLGTAHAVNLAKDFIGGEPFLLMFGDDLMYNDGKPVSAQLIEAYERTGKTVLGCKSVDINDVPKYASVEYSKQDGKLYFADKITEKPPLSQVKSTLAPLGRYVCTPDVFEYISKISPGANGELQITDAFDLQARDGRAVAYEFEGARYDTGDKLGYLKAVVEYALRDEDLGEEFKEYINGIK